MKVEQFKEYRPTRETLRKLEQEGYAEIPYIEYYPDGCTCEGTEDFSFERWKSQVVERYVYSPTKRLYPSGNAEWRPIAVIYAKDARTCGKVARRLYENRPIQIRKY